MKEPSLVARARANGWFWTWRRALREIYAPETRIGRALRPITSPSWQLFVALRRFARGSGRAAAGGGFGDTVTLFYDLDVAPITYDFCLALAVAEARRRELGCAHLHVVFVPGRMDGLRPESGDYEAMIGPESRRWRLHNVCVPSTGLMRTCRGYTVAESREQAAALRALCGDAILPAGYEASFPISPALGEVVRVAAAGHDVRTMEAPEQGLVYLRQWIETHAGARKLVTITLRDYAFMPGRNSNIAAWTGLARELDAREYCVVFVPDTDSAMLPRRPELADFLSIPEATWNIGLRAALYESAWLNLGSSGGPMTLCWLLAKARYLMFNIIVPSVPQATVETVVARGYRVGEQPPFIGRHQKWVWEPDDLDVIRREFMAMAAQIAAEPPAVACGILAQPLST